MTEIGRTNIGSSGQAASTVRNEQAPGVQFERMQQGFTMEGFKKAQDTVLKDLAALAEQNKGVNPDHEIGQGQHIANGLTAAQQDIEDAVAKMNPLAGPEANLLNPPGSDNPLNPPGGLRGNPLEGKGVLGGCEDKEELMRFIRNNRT